jgi:hypothetical protein
MSGTRSRPNRQPSGARSLFVAIISPAPIFSQALAEILESIGEVRTFPARSGDTAGLLRALSPDAVVIGGEDELEEAAAFARETGVPLLHISLVPGTLRIWTRAGWRHIEDNSWAPESIRNALIGAIYRPGDTSGRHEMSETPDIATAAAAGRLVSGQCIGCDAKIEPGLVRLGSVRCHDCRREQAVARYSRFAETLETARQVPPRAPSTLPRSPFGEIRPSVERT